MIVEALSGRYQDLWHLLVVDILPLFLLVIAAVVLFRKFRATRQAERDLGRARKTLDNVAAQEAIFHAVAQNASDGLVYQDMEAHILWANPAYCRTMGCELSDIVGRKPQEFCFPPEDRMTDQEIADFRFDPADQTFRTFHRRQNVRANGERFWHEFSQAVVEPRPGEQRVVLVSRDVTHQVQRERELEEAKGVLSHAADHDALTGLLNRSAFLRHVEKAMADPDGRAPLRPLGLLYIDLDRFKAVNDSHGHSVGDRVLCHVADAVSAIAGTDGLCCRIGGDEFVVAIPDVPTFEALQLLADALLDHIRTPVSVYDTSVECNASIGLALNDTAGARAEDLIRSADFALYEAKRPGAPAIARYDAELHSRQEADNAMMEEFIHALDNGGLEFHFQPVMDGRSGKIRSFETLARWTRDNGERVPPDRFLPYAERVNRMTDVDFAALRACASLVAELQARGHTIHGAFNTSSEALAHGDFLTRLEEEALTAGVKPDHLIAEVLETTFFGADATHSVAAARINQLRDLGHSVYLDDFGIGYAGLAHLGQLNVSGVKLDRSLIANVTHDRSARIITTSILRLCQALGVGTIAEGIETREQAEFLLKHGCYQLQGFGIARPMPRDAFLDLVAHGEEIVIPSEHDLSTGLRAAS